MKTKKNASELNNNNNNENSDPNENACYNKFCLRDIVSIGINGSVVA